MRRALCLAIPLALTGLAWAAPSSWAGCYGVRSTATVCHDGDLTLEETTYEQCVYTGGDECTVFGVPGVAVKDIPNNVHACVAYVGCCSSPVSWIPAIPECALPL